MVGWFGYTALQHFIAYIALVSVVNVKMCSRSGLVGSYHLAPSNSWLIFSPPIPLGVSAEFDGVKPFYTLGHWAYYILPLTHRGDTRHYDIILNRQMVPVSMQYECVRMRVDV